MDTDTINREIYFCEKILGEIQHIDKPILCYEEEKGVVRKALSEYKSSLESKLRGR